MQFSLQYLKMNGTRGDMNFIHLTLLILLQYLLKIKIPEA